MRLSPNFTVSEFIVSEVAARHGIDNSLPDKLMGNARGLALGMQMVRKILSNRAGCIVPITITSAYRCIAVNTHGEVKGSDTSAHVFCCAADFHAAGFSDFEAASALVGQLPYDQLIYEPGRCVHISFGRREIGDSLRMQALTQRGGPGSPFAAGIVL
jgi:zinc D-Ala-D-Ala carboxypeptidase